MDACTHTTTDVTVTHRVTETWTVEGGKAQPVDGSPEEGLDRSRVVVTCLDCMTEATVRDLSKGPKWAVTAAQVAYHAARER